LDGPAEEEAIDRYGLAMSCLVKPSSAQALGSFDSISTDFDFLNPEFFSGELSDSSMYLSGTMPIIFELKSSRSGLLCNWFGRLCLEEFEVGVLLEAADASFSGMLDSLGLAI
jgi:hypothetical protein